MGQQEKKLRMEIQGLSKSYREGGVEKPVVKDISLDVYDNEFLAILGPGLCGKTVLLNMLAGIEKPDSGTVRLDGKSLGSADSRIAMVFQKLALMPWKTVMENVEIGLKFAGVNKKERRAICQKYIALVGLEGFENAYPNQLSGGMKQRVGIARAYASDPQVLIMDEPFGQLDAQTRIVMEHEILRMWEKEKRTVLFVTNNIEEALFLGDRLVLLSKCPARISQNYEIKMKRPRDTMDQEFIRMRTEISGKMDLPL